MGEEEQRVRLFVGGLGTSVAASDLESAFGALGAVRAVEMIRSGDRDFAYIDFEASSPAALRKVFSTYKGCKWKGGCLRVEMAKEHYLQRLEREWAAARDDQRKDGEERRKMPMIPTTRALKVFFPRSRKLKVVTGGKHKRSFERCASHPLALLGLCSCGEHQDQEGADPFDFEHSGYLRLVEELEVKQLEEAGNLASSSKAGTSKSEDAGACEEKQGKNPSSKLLSETKRKGKCKNSGGVVEEPKNDENKIDSSQMEDDVNPSIPDEDDLRREKRKNKKKKEGKPEVTIDEKASNSREENHSTSDKENHDRVRTEDASEEEELDGVVLPGLMRKTKAKVETNDANWDTLFETAAGWRENKDLSEDSFGEQDVDDDLDDESKPVEVDQLKSSARANGSSRETKNARQRKKNGMRRPSRDAKPSTSNEEYPSIKVLTREERDKERLDEEDGAVSQAMTEANATNWDNLFGAAAGFGDLLENQDAEDESLAKQPKKRKSSGEQASKKKRQSDKVDGGSKGALEGIENGPPQTGKADNQVEKEEQQQQDQSWVRFSSWKSLIGEASAFSLSAVAGAKPEMPQEPRPVPDLQKRCDSPDNQRAKASTGASLPVSSSKKKTSNDLTESSKRQESTKHPPPSVKTLLQNKTCSFMRSPTAEEEWLASRDKLSSDYKAKHRTAVRIKRKNF